MLGKMRETPRNVIDPGGGGERGAGGGGGSGRLGRGSEGGRRRSRKSRTRGRAAREQRPHFLRRSRADPRARARDAKHDQGRASRATLTGAESGRARNG